MNPFLQAAWVVFALLILGLPVLLWPWVNRTLVIPVALCLLMGVAAGNALMQSANRAISNVMVAHIHRGETLPAGLQLHDPDRVAVGVLGLGALLAAISITMVLPMKWLAHRWIRRWWGPRAGATLDAGG